MTIWIDAQLSPSLAALINRTFDNIEAKSLRAIGLRDATDIEIFHQAKLAGAIIMSKDYDFLKLIEQHQSPPKLILITSGNTSNAYMRKILNRTLQKALDCLENGETIVEIG